MTQAQVQDVRCGLSDTDHEHSGIYTSLHTVEHMAAPLVFKSMPPTSGISRPSLVDPGISRPSLVDPVTHYQLLHARPPATSAVCMLSCTPCKYACLLHSTHHVPAWLRQGQAYTPPPPLPSPTLHVLPCALRCLHLARLGGGGGFPHDQSTCKMVPRVCALCCVPPSALRRPHAVHTTSGAIQL
jgi:hypothetical protein